MCDYELACVDEAAAASTPLIAVVTAALVRECRKISKVPYKMNAQARLIIRPLALRTGTAVAMLWHWALTRN